MALEALKWVLIPVIVLLVLLRLRSLFTRGPLHNIPGPKAPSVITGHLKEVFNSNPWNFHRSILEQYGSVAKVSGFLGEERLYIVDPLALYHIVIKDQSSYDEPRYSYALNYLLYGDGLSAAQGDEHRKQRKMLNPIFSPKHLRDLVPIFRDVAYQLRDAITGKIKNGAEEIDMMDWMTRTALELIGRAGLGYSFNIMEEGSVDEYGSAVRSLFPTLVDFALLIGTLPHLTKIGSPSFRTRVLEKIPIKGLRSIKEKVDIMEKTSEKIYRTRLAALQQVNEVWDKPAGRSKDIISLLLRENLKASEEDRLPASQVVGQMTTLIFGAMDTTSSALARILYLLALNPGVQEKLREEVRTAHASREFTYDDLDKLPYMEAIIRETLRLHPPLTVMHRVTTQDTVLPLGTPIRGVDGTVITEIPLPRDSNLMISILSLNRNKALWGEDAYEWKPDRWLKPLPAAVMNSKIPGVYSNIMTFWGGPRGCIGFKFSLLEMKVVLGVLMESFRFKLSDKEITWDMSIITVPRPEGSDSKAPSLPMKVSLLEPEVTVAG
ncbi:cytochrome P450 [Heliocybe sulcata]|uniref:Cytochrome P450 n=1 Tax=Heliocybe sulcata TaxID=5364 RepID=A0A5C3N2M8_9AGAM|nr:cytochrome P450 [Heliocybe sulcata]